MASRPVVSKTAGELLAKYSPLVPMIAGAMMRKLPRNVLREDLIAAGMLGLWDAIRRNPTGNREGFPWYVRVKIKGAMIDELRVEDWLPRRARAIAATRIGTDAYVPPPAVVRYDDLSVLEQSRLFSEPAEIYVENSERSEALQRAISRLPKRDRKIIRLVLSGMRQKDIARLERTSDPRISQIVARCIQRLKKSLL